MQVEYKIGRMYSTSWAASPGMRWKLIDITNNRAYLQRSNGEIFNTHVNDLRIPQTKAK